MFVRAKSTLAVGDVMFGFRANALEQGGLKGETGRTSHAVVP